MPGNHSEISLNEQNGIDNDNKKKKTTKKKKKKKDVTTIIDDNEFDSTNPLVVPSNSKSKNRFIAKIRKKPKSPKRCCPSSPSPCSSSSTRSGSRKGGCFRLIRPRRSERDCDGDESPVSDPNDERFSHEMLRVMLETNDFCADECNPHR